MVGWSHNWVHFHFLDICAKYKDDVVPPQSILGCLLNAHLRFTSEINVAGPSEGFFNPANNQGWSRACMFVYTFFFVFVYHTYTLPKKIVNDFLID